VAASEHDLDAPDPARLARAVETAQGAAMAEAATHWAGLHADSDFIALEHAGGWVIAGDGRSPLARALALGFDHVPSEAELDALEAIFLEREQPPRIDVASCADPSLLAILASRGYRPTQQMSILVRSLATPIDHPSPDDASDIEITRLCADDDLDEVVDVMASTFERPAPDWLRRVTRQGIIQPSTTAFLARIDADLVGGGCLGLRPPLAFLFAGGVLDVNRRRGVQSALIRGRLLWARDSGATIACIQSLAGGPTERNARRAGFRLAYTRLSLTREPS